MWIWFNLYGLDQLIQVWEIKSAVIITKWNEGNFNAEIVKESFGITFIKGYEISAIKQKVKWSYI